jgi:hypothetical protein
MGTLPAQLRTALTVAGLTALAACPTVDLGDSPADIGSCRPDREYFETDIWPRFIDNPDPAKSCISMSGCHDDSNNARSGMHLQTAMPVDFASNYMTVSRHLNCADPAASELLSYPLNFLPHPVMLFGPSDPEVVTVFLPWFDL